MPIAFAERRFKPLRRALIDRSVGLNRFEAQGAVGRQEAGERIEHRSGHIRTSRAQRLAQLTRRPSVASDDQSSPTRRRVKRRAIGSQTARLNHHTAQPDGDANSSIPSPTDRTNHPSAITTLSARAADPTESSLGQPYTLRHSRSSNECAARCDKKAAASRTAVVSSDLRSNPDASTSARSVSGRSLRADSAPTRFASTRTGVRAKAVVHYGEMGKVGAAETRPPSLRQGGLV
jgi:hypothetical protein